MQLTYCIIIILYGYLLKEVSLDCTLESFVSEYKHRTVFYARQSFPSAY